MITLCIVIGLFALGGAVFSFGAGLLTCGLRMAGGFLEMLLKVVGLLLMPVAIVCAVAFGIGYLLPILIPIGLVILVLGILFPRMA